MQLQNSNIYIYVCVCVQIYIIFSYNTEIKYGILKATLQKTLRMYN